MLKRLYLRWLVWWTRERRLSKCRVNREHGSLIRSINRLERSLRSGKWSYF